MVIQQTVDLPKAPIIITKPPSSRKFSSIQSASSESSLNTLDRAVDYQVFTDSSVMVRTSSSRADQISSRRLSSVSSHSSQLHWEAFRAAMRRGGGGSGEPASSVNASSSISLAAPTITFGNLTKSRIDANFTLSPTSNSPGAFTFVSGNTSLVTISGNIADIVGTHGTTTITANQAASGNYAAGSATMTLTVYSTYCIASPCLFGGTCVPTLEGALTDDNYVCECPEDTSGDDCGIYDDECEASGYCNSGECIPDRSGGACGNCAPCLTGDRCQTAILNCSG